MKDTLRQRVFKRLIAGEPIDQIRRDISSVSSLQRGIRMYVEQWRKDMPEFQKKIRDLELRQKGLEDDLQRVSGGVRDAEITKEDLERDLKVRRDEVDELDIRSVEVKRELDALISKLDSLRERGVTEKVLSRVGTLDFGSGDELLERISSVERHNELVRSNKIFSEGLMKKKAEYDDLQRQTESARELRDFENNALDEAARRRTMYLDANEVVQDFLEEGYDSKLLLSLLETLRGLSVKGQPNTSIKRLTDGLGGFKRLMELQDECTKKEVELARLMKELAHTEATLISMKNIVLEDLEDAKDKSIKLIHDQGYEALKLLKSLKDQYTSHLDEFKKDQIDRNELLSKNAAIKINGTTDRALENIKDTTNSLWKTLTQYENIIRKWGAAKEEAGVLKDEMRFSKIIHDALAVKDSTGNLSQEVMTLLVRFVRIFIHEKHPNAKIQPVDEIADTDSNIRRYQEYKLTTLIHMLEQYFFTKIL